MALTDEQKQEIIDRLDNEEQSKLEIILENVESFLAWLGRVSVHLYNIIIAAKAAYDVFRAIARLFGY
jgi:hypothetical protein